MAPVRPLRVRARASRLRGLFYCSAFGRSCGILGARIHGLNCGVPPLMGTCVDLSPAVHVFNATVGSNFKSIRRANVLVTISRVLRRGHIHRVRSCVGRRPRTLRVASKTYSIISGGWECLSLLMVDLPYGDLGEGINTKRFSFRGAPGHFG